MEKVEIIISNYLQEEKDEALVVALKSQNSVLIQLALKLKPNLVVGAEKLLYYAVENADIELLGELLWRTEIANNVKIMDEAIRLAVLSQRVEWFDVLERLLEEGGNINVALATLFENRLHKNNAIMWLVKKGATVYIQPMHLERNPKAVEEIFKAGYGKSIEFSSIGFDVFINDICQKNRVGVIKCLIKDRPDLIDGLTQIAVTNGYSRVVKLLCEEEVITEIDDNIFEKAIRENYYLIVKYLVEYEIHKVRRMDIINAVAFGSTKMLFFFLDEIKKDEPNIPPSHYEPASYIACIYDRKDNLTALLEAGYECDFNKNIKVASVHGCVKIVDILMEHAIQIDSINFDLAIQQAIKNNHIHTAHLMKAYKVKHPDKFQ